MLVLHASFDGLARLAIRVTDRTQPSKTWEESDESGETTEGRCIDAALEIANAMTELIEAA